VLARLLIADIVLMLDDLEILHLYDSGLQSTFLQCKMQTRDQSDLAKAASKVPHTLHAQDSVALAIPEISMGLQKLKVGHMTLPRAP